MGRIVMLVVLLCGMNAYADVSVAIGSAHDEAGANDELLRGAVLAQLSTTPELTARNAKARRVDVRIVAMRANDSGAMVTISTQLEVVICDQNGKMLAKVTNGAQTEVTRRVYERRYGRIRRQLIEDAVQGMFAPLRSHLLASA